jgi:hypothetical protein
MANVGPLAQGGLDEAFGLAVGARSVRAGEAVLDAELEAGSAEVSGAIARTVVGEQAADGDAVLGIEGDGGAQEGDGGFGLLVGQHAGEGEAGVIVDGDVQGLPAGELRAAAPTAIATKGDLRIDAGKFEDGFQVAPVAALSPSRAVWTPKTSYQALPTHLVRNLFRK